MADLIGLGSSTKAIPAATLSEISCLKSESAVNGLGFSIFNDNLVAGAYQDGSVAIFDLQTKKLQFKL
jgi:hypothetical protein